MVALAKSGQGWCHPFWGGFSTQGCPGGMVWFLQSPGVTGLLEPLIPWVTWRKDERCHPVPARDSPSSFTQRKWVWCCFSNRQVGVQWVQPQSGALGHKKEVLRTGGVWSDVPSLVFIGYSNNRVREVPVLSPSQECGLLSELWLKPVVGQAMGAVMWRRFRGALG